MTSTNEFHPLHSLGADLPWLARLAPEHPSSAVVSASSRAHFTRAVRLVGRGPVDWAVEVGYHVTQRISRDIPAFDEGDDSFEVLRMATESTTIQLLLALSGADVGEASTTEAVDCVTDFVRRGISLDETLRGIHVDHSVMAGAFLAACEKLGDPADRLAQIQVVSERMFSFFDVFAAQMAEVYLSETARHSTSDVAATIQLVSELLRSDGPDDGHIAKRLGYKLGTQHVALIVWSSSLARDADQLELGHTATQLLRTLHPTQKLVLPVGVGRVWGWASPSGSADERIAEMMGVRLPDGVRAVVGHAASGIDGFRRSHREAEAAFSLLQTMEAPSHLVRYSDVDLLSLIMADRERALEFSRRELGELGARNQYASELRATVAAFIETQGSPHAAAVQLNVSRNTVSYRIRRAEELLGRDIAERRAQLHAALMVMSVLTD
ncbi:hypothetical protein B7R54_06085 [Subtercola boreus]|uniref:PucR family transcriptional regulator n=1 Tax=Subtercola boreus TaxID=120213 RepID=A0A3E0VGI4_9MICO|nr:helix-turn-helix domain-containing protein [Subtercola boreus]RFA08841.1 hypothetical protein B7R54_06085 [Subtercola boreus]TQL54187.1 PucR-like helix-turn-helix protein [Subtercola boreus]